MDFLRSHFVEPVRMVAGSDAVTQIRWYPSAAGALRFPGWSAFGAPVWDSEDPPDTGVGYTGGAMVWAPKRYPAPPGQMYLGTLDDFQYGLPQRPTGTNLRSCCGPLWQSAGGVGIGGTAWPGVVRVSSAADLDVEPADSTSQDAWQRSHACVCGHPGDSYYLHPRHVSHGCVCGRPHDSTTGDAYVESGACFCTHVYDTVSRVADFDSAACLCCAPRDVVTFGTPTCLCCEPQDTVQTGGLPPVACSACDGGLAYSEYTVSISGVQGAANSNCAIMNATWTLTNTRTCFWAAAFNYSFCGDLFGTLYLRNPSLTPGGWEIFEAASGTSWILASGASWDCVSPVTLYLVPGTSCCTGWPATVTVAPVLPP